MRNLKEEKKMLGRRENNGMKPEGRQSTEKKGIREEDKEEQWGGHTRKNKI